MFPSFSELCTDTYRTHCTILWEKLSGKTVLSGAVLTAIASVSLIRWNCTISWLLSKKLGVSFYFRKVKIMTRVVLIKKKPLWISGKVNAATIQLSLCKNTSLPSGSNSQVHKNMFPSILISVKETAQIHSAMPWEVCQGRFFYEY